MRAAAEVPGAGGDRDDDIALDLDPDRVRNAAAAGTSTSGYEDGSGNFQIKKAAAAGSSPEASTWLLLLIAGLAIAGGSMGSVVLRNPA